MAWTPIDYTDGSTVATAASAAEANQFEWNGWWRVDEGPRVNPYLLGIPAYLDLDELRKEFVQRADIHVGPEEPSVKTRGKIWFRPQAG